MGWGIVKLIAQLSNLAQLPYEFHSCVSVQRLSFFTFYHFLTTGFGRIITAFLVLAGLVIVGIFTASLTSVLVGDHSDEIENGFFQIEEQLGSVTQRLDLLSSETNQGLQVLETVAQQLSPPKLADNPEKDQTSLLQ